MIVCILAPENSPSAGGVGAYTYNLARTLSKEHDVHVVSIFRDHQDSMDKLLKDSCAVAYATRASPRNSFFFNVKFQAKLATFLGRYVRQNGIEIIHSHSGHIPHLFTQYLMKTPVVATVHMTVRGLRSAIRLTKRRVLAETMVASLAPLIEVAEQAGFSRSRRLLAVSRFTFRQLADLYPASYAAKAEVLLNAVDSNLFTPPNAQDGTDTVLLNVSRPHGIKGLEIFIDTMAELRRHHPDITAKVVGGGPEGSSKPGPRHGSTVEFTGQVPYHQMPGVYRRSKLVVLTSLYENCPTVVLEAMACGRVVVAPDVGGISELVDNGKTGCLYDPSNPRSLLDTITSLIADSELIARIESNARSAVCKLHTWQARLPALVNAYREVLDGNRVG
jgi:glycosyltransferase involved in cell wall biosynthesis